MFRKKKGSSTPQVIVLDDEAPNPSTAVPSRPTYSSNTYDRLELNTNTLSAPTSEQLDAMDEAQLQQLVEQSAQAGKDSTARALQVATEARQIGADTAAVMQQQTAQLERMTDEIEVVHSHLDKSERTIEKMTRPKLVRMFQIKRTKGKGLDKHRASRKEEEEREKLRAEGLDSIDVRGMQNHGDGTVAMKDLNSTQSVIDADNDDSNNGKNRLQLFAGRKKKSTEDGSLTNPQSSRDIQEDYSQYPDGVADVLRKQDQDLDKISDALGDMKSMANAMNNELEYQSKVIEEVQTFSTETSKRTKEHNRRIARFQ